MNAHAGHCDGGYLEESETWMYLSADPDEAPETARGPMQLGGRLDESKSSTIISIPKN
ncbi:MAG: hypothetical protein ABSA11_12760 [Candidatus Bathyarchaeia archaeon]|jgi:hypothetical protein